MKKLVPIFVAAFACLSFGQAADKATAIYASNGTLVGLSNLSGLSDCSSRSVDGRLKDLHVEGDKATFNVRKKKESAEVQIDLSRLSDADRTMALRDLIRKSNPIRVAGYVCGTDTVITAFSIDRIY